METQKKPGVGQVMHGLSEQSAVTDKSQIYQNVATFPRLSSCRDATLLLADRVKAVEARDDHVLLRVQATYVDAEYIYRYFDYRPVFTPRKNTATITVRIGFAAPEVARITAAPGFRLPPTQRGMLVEEGERLQQVTCSETDDTITVSNGTLRAVIHKDPWNLCLQDSDGKVFYRQFGRDNNSFVAYEICPFGFLIDGDGGESYACEAVAKGAYESIYGLGENYSALDRNGRTFGQWNTNALGVNTDRGYKNIPFYISSGGYGAFYNTSRKVQFDMGGTLSKANAVMVGGELLDYFVIRGENAAQVLPPYLALTGRPVMPPKWSFGIWMSKISYGTQEEVETVSRRLRQEKLPCDVIHIDTDWFAENWVCDWRFDENKFPDFSSMINELHSGGYRLCLWQLPYIERGNISTQVYDYGVAKGYFAAKPDGDMRFPHGLIDFSNPEAVEWYQQELLRPLLEAGVDVIKVDFGESAPPFFRYGGIDGEEMHNLYALLYNKAVYEVTAQVHGEENALIWARSAWAGSQRYPLHWGGDAGTDFGSMASSIRGMLSLGLCGFPFWSSDIGGFWYESDPVLYIRWFQYGMFCSHARLHGFYTREPWDFGEKAVEAYRKYGGLRYRLMPYIHSQAHKAVETGLPMQRALIVDYPQDPTVSGIDTQYLFGESLLVCPVLDPNGFVRIYLPRGVWTDFYTGERLTGGQWLEFTAALEEMPLYVRENAILPMGPEMQYVDETETDPLELRLYPVAGEGCFHLAEENTDITLRAGEMVELTITPCAHNLVLRFVNTDCRSCVLNGQEQAGEREGADFVLHVSRDMAERGIQLTLK